MAQEEFVHGSMDVTTQEKTFAGFLKFATRAIIIMVVALVVVALANA